MVERETTYEIAQLREAYAEIERQSTDGFLKEYVLPSIDAWLQILLDCHAFAIDSRQREEHAAVMESYASVSAVAYCNAENARIALLRGFYGNTFALARALAMANDLVIDLMKTPESPDKWLTLRDFKPGKGGAEAKRLREYFQDGAVRQRVRELKEHSLASTVYSILSDPVHATPWSTHLFSYESLTEPGTYSIQYRPQFHPLRSLMCGGFIVATLPHLSGYFLEWCQSHYAMSKRYTDLAQRHTGALLSYEEVSRMHRALLDRFDAANQRLRDGERFEDVFPS